MSKMNVMQAIRNLSNPNYKNNRLVTDCAELMANAIIFAIEHRELDRLALETTASHEHGLMGADQCFYLPLQTQPVGSDNMDFVIDGHFTVGGNFFFKAGFHIYKPKPAKKDTDNKEDIQPHRSAQNNSFGSRSDVESESSYSRMIKGIPESTEHEIKFRRLEDTIPATLSSSNSRMNNCEHRIGFLETILENRKLQESLRREGYRIFITPINEYGSDTLEIALV